ncbi:hypothetical protein KC909_06720, partial [Candidatus Dojkabacteria bacterium]|nr:hypothetical protein [Candidatus Dojkabacteria bacterium]
NPGQSDTAQVLDTNVYRTNPFTETVSEWPREAVGIVPEFKYGAYSNGSQSELDNGSYVWTILFNALDDNAYQKYIEDFKAAGWNLDTDDSIGTGYIYAANSEGYSVQASFTEDKLVLTIIQSNND